MENLQTHRVLDFRQTFRDAFVDGGRHVLPVAGCFLLWFATIWIPYINIGTMIAILLLPVELANGRHIAPLSIFSARYRRDIDKYLRVELTGTTIFAIAMYFFIYFVKVHGGVANQRIMGQITGSEFFFLKTVFLTVFPFLLIGFVPLLVLAAKWSMADFYIYDRQLSPDEAQSAWSQASDGSKWRIVCSFLLLGLVSVSVMFALTMGLVVVLDDVVTVVALLALLVAFMLSFAVALQASIWRQLKDNYKQS